MANTLGGVNLAQIAQESIPALLDSFVPVNAFTTDFSDEIATSGESVTTRITTSLTAQDVSSGLIAAAQGVTKTAKTITLNTHFGIPVEWTDVERSKSAIDLVRDTLRPMSNALAAKVFADLWNLVVDANFTAGNELVSTAANFDRDDVADLAVDLTDLKVPKMDRALLVNPTYYGALAKDLNSADTAGQVTTLGEHRIPRLHGFNVYEATAIDANAQNVTGLATHRSSIAIAARLPDPAGQTQFGYGENEAVLLDEIGIPVLFRQFWHDGKLYVTMELLYGVLFVHEAGVKIVSA